jgi:hypothetical protein
MSRTTLRSPLAALSLLAAVLAALVVPAGSASAAAYRYWGYYHLSGSSWQFASKGAEQTNPADGSVDGWRFAVAGETDTRAPRVTTTFADVCGDTAAESGKKRVAVVIDYGRAADSEDGTEPPPPVATCASVATAATGAEALAAVASVRAEKALVCGINGHPATGCGGEVKEVSAEAAAPDTSTTLAPKSSATTAATARSADEPAESGTNAIWYAGMLVVIAAAALALFLAIRRRGQH